MTQPDILFAQPEKKTQKTILAANNLSVCYYGENRGIHALHNVSFQLQEKETLGIIGESGSGKTTLALALLGLIEKPHAVLGQALLGEEDMLALQEEEKKKLRWDRIALVFQNSQEVLNPVLSIGEQVEEPLRRHRDLGGKELDEELQKLFSLVGLDYFWQEAYPHQLSGGMRQRVLLAMALSCQPELLIVDEPSTSLDAIARKEILDMLKALQKELGFSMIVISHDLAAMENLVDRLMVLYGGEVLESGPTIPLIENPLHPYTRGLINSSIEVHPYKDLWGIPGEASETTEIPTACAFAGRCTQEIVLCRQSKPALTETTGERAVRCHRGGIISLLQAGAVSKSYKVGKRNIHALQQTDLKLYHGETAALVGTSGSGKSTLAMILAGLIEPDQGEVIFNGHPVYDSKEARQENGIQLVMQDPFSSLSHRLSVAEAVDEPLLINKLGSTEARQERIKEALQAVSLPFDQSFLQRFCHSLSGGQRQRLAIARALVMRPALFIADEITSMLDVSTQANIMRMLKGLQYSRGFTMLYITHDLHLARKVAERIIVLHHGQIVEEGSARKVTEQSCCCHTHGLMEAGLHGEHVHNAG